MRVRVRVVWCVWIVRGTNLVARQPRAAQHTDIQEGLLHLEELGLSPRFGVRELAAPASEDVMP